MKSVLLNVSGLDVRCVEHKKVMPEISKEKGQKFLGKGRGRRQVKKS